jgi:hypothetical protein
MSLISTDFIVYGSAEPNDNESARFALLPSLQNHRRCLLEPVLLTSNHSKVTDFVVTIVKVEDAAKHDVERAKLPASLRLGVERVTLKRTLLTSNNSASTAFVLMPSAPSEKHQKITALGAHLPAGIYDCSYAESNSPMSIIPNPAEPLWNKSGGDQFKLPLVKEKMRQERTSNDSVMDPIA